MTRQFISNLNNSSDQKLLVHSSIKPKSYQSLFSLANMISATYNIGCFSQLVQEPTKFQYNSVTNSTNFSCIDHVYTTHKFRCSDVRVVPFGNSDHDLIEYVRYCKEPPAPSRTIRKRSYKNFDLEKFREDLQLVDWSPVYENQDVDNAVSKFTSLFNYVLNHHAPWVVFQQRRKFTPWVTDETLKLMKERDVKKKEASTLARNCQDSALVWADYKRLRNKINNRIRSEEKKFKCKIMQENLETPSKCWKTAKAMMNWSSDSGPPTSLELNGKLVVKAAQIASAMNIYFIQKVMAIRDNIQSIPNSFSKCYEIMRGKNTRLELQHVSLPKVLKMLKNLKSTRSTSIDGLDNFSIKVSADIVANPVHHIISLSIMQLKFPSQWKYSKVIPLHKRSSKLVCKNYRPVSILSPLSKILEKAIYMQLYS